MLESLPAKHVSSNDTNKWPQTGWLGPLGQLRKISKNVLFVRFRFGNNGFKWSPNLADILGDTDFDFESFHFLIPCSQISRLHEFNIDRFLDYQIPDSMLSARGNQSTALRHFCDSSGPQIGQALFLHVCCRKPSKYRCFWTLVVENILKKCCFCMRVAEIL